MQIKSKDIRFKEVKSLLHDSIKYQLMTWVTIKGSAIYSGLSETTIRRAVQLGTLKANKVGGRWQIKPEWLANYLSS